MSSSYSSSSSQSHSTSSYSSGGSSDSSSLRFATPTFAASTTPLPFLGVGATGGMTTPPSMIGGSMTVLQQPPSAASSSSSSRFVKQEYSSKGATPGQMVTTVSETRTVHTPDMVAPVTTVHTFEERTTPGSCGAVPIENQFVSGDTFSHDSMPSMPSMSGAPFSTAAGQMWGTGSSFISQPAAGGFPHHVPLAMQGPSPLTMQGPSPLTMQGPTMQGTLPLTMQGPTMQGPTMQGTLPLTMQGPTMQGPTMQGTLPLTMQGPSSGGGSTRTYRSESSYQSSSSSTSVHRGGFPGMQLR